MSGERDEFGRRIYPHPEGQRWPLTVGHDHTRCRLMLPHRGDCWPEWDQRPDVASQWVAFSDDLAEELAP